MNNNSPTEQFLQLLQTSFKAKQFVKLTCSKPVGSNKDLKNIYGRRIEIKGQTKISCTYRFTTKDEVKNYALEELLLLLQEWIGNSFLNVDLLTSEQKISLQLNKKRKARLLIQNQKNEAPSITHDKQKKRLILAENNPYLKALGITNQTGKVLQSGQKKFRQINKYIEIISSILQQTKLPTSPQIVDMGSGKGYLTFALYDYLKHQLKLDISITGIELRENLVDFCNQLAQDCKYEQLQFLAQDITTYQSDKIDFLIALHACDIATDIAIAKGIKADANAIIVAPCCHKQVRKSMQCTTEMQSILRHGILLERQAELLTDGIRALLLEAHGYKTQVFEFISTEHTPKNVMIIATKGKKKSTALAEIAAIKKEFGIKEHYLEKLLFEPQKAQKIT